MRASFKLPFAAAPPAQTGEASQSAADGGSATAVLDRNGGAAAGSTTGAEIRAFIDAASPAADAGSHAADAAPQQPDAGTSYRGHFLCRGSEHVQVQ